MLALVLTYVVPPVRAFRAPARDHRVALPALRIPAFDLPRLNPPERAAASKAHRGASPFSVSSRPAGPAAQQQQQQQQRTVRKAVPQKQQQRRRVRVPVVTSSYVARPQPAAQSTKPKADPWANAAVVDNATGASPADPPAAT